MNEGDELLYVPIHKNRVISMEVALFLCIGEMMMFFSTQKYAEKLSNIRR